MKKTSIIKQKNETTVSAARKAWGIVALVGLFVCGVFVGAGMHTSRMTPVAANATIEMDAPIATCVRIEQLLGARLNSEDDTEYDAHLENAEIYARMSENGCAENIDKYRALAAREIQIATALLPVDEMDESGVEDVVDVYKKIQMQAAAQQVINKLQKMTDPAIDFILKLEKIIDED